VENRGSICSKHWRLCSGRPVLHGSLTMRLGSVPRWRFIRTLKGICEQELLLSYARLDADFGTDNFARNDDFEAAVFLAAAAALSSAKGCLIPAGGRDGVRVETLSDQIGADSFPRALRIVFVHRKQSFNRARVKE
jgi:hypothetical protein